MAHPVARSSHKVPTPQGAGIGTAAASIAAAAISMYAFSLPSEQLKWVLSAAAVMAFLGAADDRRPIPVLARLVLQMAATAALIAILPEDARVMASLPLWLERACLLLVAVGFINITNFMDGLDWMTVAEVLPVTAALTALGVTGLLSEASTLIAAALFGAYVGFAPFNRPVAKVFLGDVGSLSTGLLLAWCLIDLAMHGHAIAALILPLYYLADAGWTLAARVIRREKIWVAHRTHFYQRATDNGFSVQRIVMIVFCLNLILAGLGMLSALVQTRITDVVALAGALLAVALILRSFSQPRTLSAQQTR